MSRNRILAAVTVVSLLFAVGSHSFAQDFSPTQKQVWSSVEAYWDLEMKQDLEGFLSYFDESYLGWPNDEALPNNKAAVRKFVAHEMASTKVLVQDLKPIAINVHGDFAFADYYYSRVIKDEQGKEKTEFGRWTDILIRRGDKWVLIGDHGGPTSHTDDRQ